MFMRYVWLLLLISGAYILFSNNYYVELTEKYLTKCLEDFLEVINNNEEEIADQGEKIWTQEELKKYKTLETGLYLAILGQVFDVTTGEKHYGSGKTYHSFTGCDASLAFITGDFNEEGLKDDISSLSAQQTKALSDWVDFYKKTYVYKGKLNGYFYNADGSPTTGFYHLQAKLKEAEEIESFEARKNWIFPPCNIEWNPDSGTRVWCTNRSGGIHRDWVGVPRMYFENANSKQHRCACVNLESKEFKENQANFREFKECLTDSSYCFIEVDN